MKALKKLGAIIYFVLMVGVGATLLAVSLKVLSPEKVAESLTFFTGSVNMQVTLGVIGAILLMLGVIAPMRAAKGSNSARVVKFQNPDGEVAVSLSAIEEYIRKIAKEQHEIGELKCYVDINRKGVDITCAISIAASANIPEVTEKMQLAIKNHLQVLIGMEEKISIKMQITRIMGNLPPGAGYAPEEIPQGEVPSQVPPYREM
jgi:uncharacterized alkaline shock family protein YloU